MSRGFLLDTNIPSEQIRSRPESRVGEWMYAQSEESLFLSVVTTGELRKGLVLLAGGRRRTELERWFEIYLVPRFYGRILPMTQTIADRWGAMDAECQLRGTPLDAADGLIAATALAHELVVVTRNVKDFIRLGVPLLNPWEEG